VGERHELKEKKINTLARLKEVYMQIDEGNQSIFHA